MNERSHFFIKIYLSHFILERVDVGWVWQMSWNGDRQYFFLILAGLLNRRTLRAQSPLSAAGFQFGILSPTDSKWLKPSVPWLYYCLTTTYFRRSSAYLHWCIS